MAKNTTVLLVNLGTPDSPKRQDVRKYLSEFLNDHRVMDMPWLTRKILVNLIIVPFRSKNSAALYKKLWTKKGSPLLYHAQDNQKLLQERLGSDYTVELAMRYQNPSLSSALERIKNNMPHKLIIIPLFPQYASSTTGAIMENIMKTVQKWEVIPEISFTNQFFDHPKFIDTIYENAKKENYKQYDHILFSFHGLPLRQINKVHPQKEYKECNCHLKYNEDSDFHCYKATCYQTARLLVEKLGLSEDDFSIAFQSRLTKDWLEPFADKTVEELAKKGKKKLLVFSPSFVSDCLETNIEISEEYKDIFMKNGGSELKLVESLNSNPNWISCLEDLVKSKV